MAVCLTYPALADKAKEPSKIFDSKETSKIFDSSKELSNTYQASCIVNFKGNSDIHAAAFQGLISSSAVAGKAGRDVLKVTGKDIGGYIIIQTLVKGQNEYTFELKVKLPDNDPEIKPLAEEFLAAVIKNMESSLNETYNNQRNLLLAPVQSAREELNDAKLEFEKVTGVSPVSETIEKQLDMVVDLSTLDDDMAIYEALDILSKSIKPALPIAVMWKDLSENAFIEKEEPVGIDGGNMSAVRLGTALNLVLKSVGGNSAKVGYAIEGGILIIATREQLPAPVPAVELFGDFQLIRNNLVRDKANYELEIAEQEAYHLAIIKQINTVSYDMKLRVKTDEITDQLREIVKLRDKRFRDLDYVSSMSNAQPKPNQADINKAKEDLAKAKIDYAKRRQEVGKEAGGDKLRELNDKLGDIAVDVSVRKAMYAVVKKQLNEVDAMLAAASKYESKRSAIKVAKTALADAEYKVEELEKQQANLTPPVVTVIGAN